MTVYTDGAAYNADYALTARAGWAVWYSDNSAHNYYRPLAGYIQSSHRAELRAILHVVRTAINPTIIMCDCLAVVNALLILLKARAAEGEHLTCLDMLSNKIADYHIWQKVAQLVDHAPPHYFRIQWTPRASGTCRCCC